MFKQMQASTYLEMQQALLPKFLAMMVVLFCITGFVTAQSTETDSTAAATSPAKKDSVGKFDSFNKKMEHLFKIIPAPIFSYSSDAGNIFGLTKFNVFKLSKNYDSITKPSKLSEVVTFSTKGRVNVSVSNELVFNKNKYIIVSFINYKKQPEYIFGIGNDVKKEDLESLEYERFKFFSEHLFKIGNTGYLYMGVPLDIGKYFNVKPDSNSFLYTDHVTGVDGGFSLGTGLSLGWDSRDNRYNTYKGSYILAHYIYYPSFLGSTYEFSKFLIDARKFYNPWLAHVIALQATASYSGGDVPFYELSLMGGDNRMRGYYLGAYRDKLLVDAQVEYRAPLWKIFGATAWVGTGRVAPSLKDLSINGFHITYGFGLRLKVDSKSNTNLRFDFGFGNKGIKGTYVSFAEAF